MSTMRDTGNGRVVYELVTDQLQRMFVMVPRRLSTSEQVGPILEHAIAGLVQPTKPLSAKWKQG